MDWRLVLAILCLIAASATADTSTNQTVVNTTLANTTSTNTTSTNTSSNQNTSSPNASTNTTSTNTSNSNANTTNSTSTNTSPNQNTSITNVSSNMSSPSASTNTSSTNNSTQIASTNTSSTNNSTQIASTNTSSTNASTATANPPPVNTGVAATFNLTFSINENFDPALSNTNSPQFIAKSQLVGGQLDTIYRRVFVNLIRVIIIRFRSGSTVVDSSLDFSANGTIPNNSTIQNTLVNASNANSSLNIIPNSISVTQVSAPNTPTTTNTSNPSTSTNTSSANSTNPSTSTNTSSANATNLSTSSTTSSANTTILTTTPTTTPSITNATSIFSLIFSIIETFNAALSNTSSPEFTANSTNIRNQVEPPFKRKIPSFNNMTILKFSPGSTVVQSTLSIGTNVSASQVKSIFLGALVNFTFTVDPNSVNITQILGNSMSPVIASSLSIIWMSLLSLLLSMALQF